MQIETIIMKCIVLTMIQNNDKENNNQVLKHSTVYNYRPVYVGPIWQYHKPWIHQWNAFLTLLNYIANDRWDMATLYGRIGDLEHNYNKPRIWSVECNTIYQCAESSQINWHQGINEFNSIQFNLFRYEWYMIVP